MNAKEAGYQDGFNTGMNKHTYNDDDKNVTYIYDEAELKEYQEAYAIGHDDAISELMNDDMIRRERANTPKHLHLEEWYGDDGELK